LYDDLLDKAADDVVLTDEQHSEDVQESRDSLDDQNDLTEQVNDIESIEVKPDVKKRFQVPFRRNYTTASGRRTTPTWKIANTTLYDEPPTTDDSHKNVYCQ
jgi:hypothetical protein